MFSHDREYHPILVDGVHNLEDAVCALDVEAQLLRCLSRLHHYVGTLPEGAAGAALVTP